MYFCRETAQLAPPPYPLQFWRSRQNALPKIYISVPDSSQKTVQLFGKGVNKDKIFSNPTSPCSTRSTGRFNDNRKAGHLWRRHHSAPGCQTTWIFRYNNFLFRRKNCKRRFQLFHFILYLKPIIVRSELSSKEERQSNWEAKCFQKLGCIGCNRVSNVKS